MKGKVLFIGMYCHEDEGFEYYPLLKDDEVGKDNLVLRSCDLENEGMNDDANCIEFNDVVDGRIQCVEVLNDAANYVSIYEEVISRQNKLDKDNESDSDDNDDEYAHIFSDSESDESDKSFDYMSNGEDVDTRNDVDKFTDKDDNGLGLTPLIREHEKYLKALLRKLKGNEMRITNLFATVEKSKDMYPVYDDLTHWKLKKPKLDEKFPTIKKFKECLTYYALENGFSLWFERSNTNKVVAKYGQRKETIKDPRNGNNDPLRSFHHTMQKQQFATGGVMDGNNHIFPIAWVMVTIENKENWSWFLDLLADDLELPNGNGLTLMSDQHKGLIEAAKEVMPFLEHRQYARHIYEGSKKQFSKVEFRRLFWAAFEASYPQLFNKIMEKIKRSNPRAHQYLLAKDPKPWSRAFFTKGMCCDAVKNGFSECFNSVLDVANIRYMLSYSQYMKLVDGINFWPIRSHLSRILGHKSKKMPSRPNKKRVMASHEPKSTARISRYVEDINDLRFFETKFPSIVYDDALISELEFSSEPTEMEDRDMTIEEYVQYETEKALRNGKVYNWKTTTYGKIRYVEDINDLRFFETKFPSIVYDDALISELEFSSEPTVSPLYAEKVNLKNKTSLSEYDDEECNVISYNDLFPFNIFSIDDSKLDTENDDDKIDIKQTSRHISIEPLRNVISIDVGTYAQRLSIQRIQFHGYGVLIQPGRYPFYFPAL
ncbi:pentatricopeptide repeat-containing protein [Tanacetum coccineum]